MLRAVVAVLTLTLVGAAASPARAADEGAQSGAQEVTFSVQPAGASGPDGRPYLSWGATAGASLDDQVAFVNYGNADLPLSVYAADALNTDDGGFGLLPTAKKSIGAGAWIDIAGPDEIVVPARTRRGPGVVQADVTLRVPGGVAPGDYSAGVVAVLTSTDDSGGPDVRLEQRVASRVFVRVAGNVEASLAIENLATEYHQSWNPFGPGSATVTYTVRNTGNINLSGTQVVAALGLVADASVRAADLELLLPGGRVDVVAEVPDVWPQIWMESRVTVAPVDASPAGGRPYPAVSATAGFWAVPWALLALVSLLVALGAAAWFRRRSRGWATETAPELVGAK